MKPTTRKHNARSIPRLTSRELLNSLHGVFVAILCDPDDAKLYAGRGEKIIEELSSRVTSDDIGNRKTGFRRVGLIKQNA